MHPTRTRLPFLMITTAANYNGRQRHARWLLGLIDTIQQATQNKAPTASTTRSHGEPVAGRTNTGPFLCTIPKSLLFTTNLLMVWCYINNGLISYLESHWRLIEDLVVI